MVNYTSGGSASSPAVVATTITTSLESTETAITTHVEEQLENTIQQLKEEIDANEQKIDSIMNMLDSDTPYDETIINDNQAIPNIQQILYCDGVYWIRPEINVNWRKLVKTTDLKNFELVSFYDDSGETQYRVKQLIYYNKVLYVMCYPGSGTKFTITKIFYTSDQGATWSEMDPTFNNVYIIFEHNGVYLGLIENAKNIYYSNTSPIELTLLENAFASGKTRRNINWVGDRYIIVPYNINYAPDWSYDGITWQETSKLSETYLSSSPYPRYIFGTTGRYFITVSAYPKDAYFSTDCSTWEKITLQTTNTSMTIIPFNNVFDDGRVWGIYSGFIKNENFYKVWCILDEETNKWIPIDDVEKTLPDDTKSYTIQDVYYDGEKYISIETYATNPYLCIYTYRPPKTITLHQRLNEIYDMVKAIKNMLSE